jgi:hypothetical protein
MCQNPTKSPSTDQRFTSFCVSLRRWLADAPRLDPSLAAALDLLDRRVTAHGFTWFECEVTHLARNSEDIHSALGAGVLLSLWNGVAG